MSQPTTPTAAGVSVSSRLTFGKRGIRNALVTLTELNGATRTILSGTNGIYRFANVAGGQNVMLTVRAKDFIFAPDTQVVNAMQDVENIDFTAQNNKFLLL